MTTWDNGISHSGRDKYEPRLFAVRGKFNERASNYCYGSQAVIPNSVQNVRSWVISGPQFKVTGGLFVAEAVEELV